MKSEEPLKKKPSIIDVAREAGVGIATVSRCLDPMKRRDVSEGVLRRVDAAIEKTGYDISRRFKRKKAKRKYTFGVLTALSKDIFNSRYHTGILSGIFDRIGKISHDLKFILLKERHYARLEEMLFEHGLDGLMILTWRIHPSLVELVEKGSGELPLIIFNDYDSKLKVNILYTDVREGMKQAVFYLFEKGYRKIGMLSGPADILFHEQSRTLEVPSIDVYEKTQGFLEAFKEKKIPVSKNMIKRCHSYTEGDGYQHMKAWIKKGNLPEAVVCANDEIALGALRALKESRIWCPENMKLIGFDDIEKASLVSPKLTTVRQPLYQMGSEAVDILIERVEFPWKEPIQKRYMPELVVRQTA
jgi:DNA-binding LacI/PurR family transcriptional regulator